MPEKPNILLINVDDLGWKDLTCMGSSFYETPNIDKLAKEGVLYTSGYASAANCAPSRANLMTGRYSRRHGVITVGDSERGDEKLRRVIPIPNKSFLPKGIKTMPEVLKDQGYFTGMIGKWHITHDPLDNGFFENVAGYDKGMPSSYFAPYNNPALDDGEEGEYLPERLSLEVCSFLDRHKDETWFLYYATYLVHTPIQGKDEVTEKYRKRLEQNGNEDGQANPVYAAMVEALDDAVGKVIDKLEELGLSDNTLVVFTSDNGGIRTISDQYPLRAGKGSYYEGGIRVPLIMRWPNQIKANSFSHEPITNLDFLPTFLNLAGGDARNGEWDGDDISNTFLQSKNEPCKERSLFWDFPVYLGPYDSERDDGRDVLFRTRPGATLRHGDWKIHYYYEDQSYELYNLRLDIGERMDLSKTEFAKLEQLKNLLKGKMDEVGASMTLANNPKYEARFEKDRSAAVQAAEEPKPQSEKEWYQAMSFID